MSGGGGTAHYEGPAHFLDNARHGSKGWRAEKEFDLQAWQQAAQEAPLSKAGKQTAELMAEYSTSRGVSKIDRTSVAKAARVNRPETITQRWKALREAGLMTSALRFNSSPVHLLTTPSGRSANPLDTDVLDIAQALEWKDGTPQDEAPF